MYKQVIIIRKDLNLTKGKIAAQVAHASLEAYKKVDETVKKEWDLEGSKKVVLKVESLKKLLEIYDNIKKLHLPCSLIKDAGRTQVSKNTVTCIGIGPEKEEKIDKITKNLKLL